MSVGHMHQAPYQIVNATICTTSCTEQRLALVMPGPNENVLSLIAVIVKQRKTPALTIRHVRHPSQAHQGVCYRSWRSYRSVELMDMYDAQQTPSRLYAGMPARRYETTSNGVSRVQAS